MIMSFHVSYFDRQALAICTAVLLTLVSVAGQQQDDPESIRLDQQRGLLEQYYVHLPLLDGAIKVEIRDERIIKQSFVLVPSGDGFLLMVPKIQYLVNSETKEVRLELRCGFPKLSKDQVTICKDIVETIRLIRDVPPPQSYAAFGGLTVSIIFDEPHEKTKMDPFFEDPNRITWRAGDVKEQHRIHLESLIDQLGTDLIGFVALEKPADIEASGKK